MMKVIKQINQKIHMICYLKYQRKENKHNFIKI